MTTSEKALEAQRDAHTLKYLNGRMAGITNRLDQMLTKLNRIENTLSKK